MAKKKAKKANKGEQLELLDVAPENAKDIIACARRYKNFLAKRLKVLSAEKNEKQNLLALIEKANLSRLNDGKIRFHCDGYVITVTPRDELVQVKEDKDDNTPNDPTE
jgi:hypothetical protein